jgi:hypothetical protein
VLRMGKCVLPGFASINKKYLGVRSVQSASMLRQFLPARMSPSSPFRPISSSQPGLGLGIAKRLGQCW